MRVLRAMSPTVVGKVVSDDDGDEQKYEPSSKDVGSHGDELKRAARLGPPVCVLGAISDWVRSAASAVSGSSARVGLAYDSRGQTHSQRDPIRSMHHFAAIGKCYPGSCLRRLWVAMVTVHMLPNNGTSTFQPLRTLLMTVPTCRSNGPLRITT